MSEHRYPRAKPKGEGYKQSQRLSAPSRLLSSSKDLSGLMLRRSRRGLVMERCKPEQPELLPPD